MESQLSKDHVESENSEYKSNKSTVLVILMIIVFWILVYICTGFLGKIFLAILTLLVIYCIWIFRCDNNKEDDDINNKNEKDTPWTTPFYPAMNQVREKFEDIILI